MTRASGNQRETIRDCQVQPPAKADREWAAASKKKPNAVALSAKRPPYETSLEALQKIVSVEATRGSGPGGQRRNKVETGVRLVHPPSGTIVVATRRASREANLREAFHRLIRKLKELNFVPKKRRPTRPSRASRERRLQGKKHHSEKKKQRQPIRQFPQ